MSEMATTSSPAPCRALEHDPGKSGYFDVDDYGWARYARWAAMRKARPAYQCVSPLLQAAGLRYWCWCALAIFFTIASNALWCL